MTTMTTRTPSSATRYTTGAVILHWTIALLIGLQLAGGYAMSNLLADGSSLQFDVYQLHKSLGVTVLVLTVARILWRLFNPAPPEPASVGRAEALLAGAVQFAFYALLILIPLAGWLVISVAAVRVETVLFFTDWLPFPDLPGFDRLDAATRGWLEDTGAEAHELLAYAMLALIGLHVAGALKHQLADGAFLSRMWFTAPGAGARHPAGAAVTVLVTVLVAAGLVGSAAISRTMLRPPPAAPQAAAVAEVPPTTAGGGAAVWILDAAASSLGYTVAYSGADVSGSFREFDARIRFSPDDLAGSAIDVTVDTASATIDSSEISLQNLDGPDGFANREHGTARFVANAIRADGAGYVADGSLTIRGETLPQSLAFTVAIDGDRATAEGTLTLDRLAYGIGRTSDAKGEWLGLSVTVHVALAATRQAAGAGAAPPVPAGEAPAWQVLPDSGRIGYAFTFDGKRVAGTLGAVAAEIRFSEDNLGGSSIVASVALDGATVTEGGVSPSQLKGAQGLAAGDQPTATFASRTIEAAADGGFVARGALSVRGVTQDVALPFRLERRSDGLVDAHGTLSLDRLAFGFATGLDSSGPTVGAEVDVDISLTGETARQCAIKQRSQG